MTDEFESSRMEYKGARSTARARLAFLHMGQVDIELVEPVGEPSTWNDQLRQHGPSIHHIALHIDGMREKLAYLDSQGLKVLQGAEFEGGRYANLDSQEKLGAILELLEF